GLQVERERLAVGSTGLVVREPLALLDAAEAGALHGRDVHEDVLRAIVGSDEAQLSGLVEVHKGAGSHDASKSGVASRIEGIDKPRRVGTVAYGRFDRTGIAIK